MMLFVSGKEMCCTSHIIAADYHVSRECLWKITRKIQDMCYSNNLYSSALK